MSDDLVKRLRVNRSTLQLWFGELLIEKYEKERLEAADRIEQLEAFAEAVIRYAGNAGDDYLADKARAALAGVKQHAE